MRELFEKTRGCLTQKKLTKLDGLAIFLLAVVVLWMFGFGYAGGALLHTSGVMEQPYSVKEGTDGTLYVLDQGHERLLHIDRSGKLRLVSKPEDAQHNPWYVTDFVTDEEGNIYLAACSWDGMCVDREVILQQDSNGNFVRQLASFQDSASVISKNRIRGLRVEDGALTYAVLADNSIEQYVDEGTTQRLVQTVAYHDAFNAISSIQIVDGQMYVLNKNGVICSMGEHKTHTIYSISDAKEEDRVPFQLAVTASGEVYFSDIYHRTIQHVVGTGSETVVSDTDSTSVFVSADGELFVVETDGIRICKGQTEQKISHLTKPWYSVVLNLLQVVFQLIGVLCVLVLVLHLIGVVIQLSFSRAMKFTCILIAVVVSVSGVLINILMEEFSNKYNDKIKEQLESAAYVAANQLEEADIKQVKHATDYGNEAYRRIVDIMTKSYPRENDFYKQIYCNIVVWDETEGAHAIAYLDQSIGTYFPIEEDEAKEVAKVYQTGQAQWNDSRADASGTYIYVKVPIKNEAEEVVGVVDVGITTTQLAQTLAELKQQVFSALVVVLLLIGLFISELSAFVSQMDSCKERQKDKVLVLPGHMLRLLVFAIYTAFNMSATFLPVYIMTHITNSFGMEKEFAASLPIMVNLFVMGVMSLFCSRLVKKMGMARLAVRGGLASVIGNLLLCICPSYPVAFVALILDAIGVGLLSNASYILITYVKDEDERMEGFSTYNGACISGINFGMMFGSILAVRLSQRKVFFWVAVCWLVVIALTCFVGKQMEQMLDMEHGQEEEQQHVTTREFLWNRVVTPFLVLIQNPYIVFNSFVFFFVPIFCEEHGYSETVVSILLVVYSGISILFGDKLTKLMSEKLKEKAMYLAYFVNIAAVVIYAWTQNMRGLLLSLLLLGLAAAFGKPVQQNYFLELEVVRKYGEDRAMGVYNFTENIGESLGPAIFGKLMFISPLNLAVSAFGGAVAMLGAFHMFLNRRKKHGTEEIN